VNKTRAASWAAALVGMQVGARGWPAIAFIGASSGVVWLGETTTVSLFVAVALVVAGLRVVQDRGR
jgi:hypothetical protein